MPYAEKVKRSIQEIRFPNTTNTVGSNAWPVKASQRKILRYYIADDLWVANLYSASFSMIPSRLLHGINFPIQSAIVESSLQNKSHSEATKQK